MALFITPKYSEIFRDSPDLELLLEKIPSKIVLEFLAFLNAYLRNGSSDRLLIRELINKLSHPNKRKFIEGIEHFRRRNEHRPIHFFGRYFIVKFMMHEIINYRDFPFEDQNPEIEYNLVKSYFAFMDIEQEKIEKLFNLNEVQQDFFNEKTWPLVIQQQEFSSTPPDPSFEAIKALIFFDELSSNNETKQFVDRFMKQIDQESYQQYISDFLNLCIEARKQDNAWVYKSIIQFDPIFDNLSIDIEKCKIHEKYHKNFLALKDKPVLKKTQGEYILLDLSFLINKTYTGLIFNFYNASGINELYNSFGDYKSILGEITERRLFSQIIKYIYQDRHYKIFFDPDQEGYPDCYMRYKNKIFLFEFKDSLMGSDIIDSFDYSSIKKHITRNFIENDRGKPKGIKQLLNYIDFLNADSFPFDDFKTFKIDHEKIVIYPIIVYTDHNYSLLGINSFLNNEFNKCLPETHFQSIESMTMVSMEYLYSNISNLKNRHLNKILDSYDNFVKRKSLELERKPCVTTLFESKFSIEHTSIVKIKDKDKTEVYNPEEFIRFLELKI